MRAYASALIALAALAALAGWHFKAISNAKDAVRVQYTEAALAQEQRISTLETNLSTTFAFYQEKEEHDAQEHQAAVAAVNADVDSLRKRLKTYADAASANPAPAKQRQGEPGAGPVHLLAGLLDRHTGELAAVGDYAFRLKAAGLACERRYGEVWRALQEAG